MSVASQGINVSPQNSSIVALGIGATFTGVGESALDFAEVDVVVYATPSNAAGTLYFEFSPDNTNWDVSVPLTITDPTNYPPIPLRVVLPFFRVRYVNGGVAQSAFRLSTVYHHLGAKMLTRFPGQTLTDAEPLEVVTAVLRAQNPAGTYTTLMLDSSSRLTTTTGVVGGGTEAAAQRVTIANDSTGVLSVDDNGGSLTVDGAVTANAGTNLNTSALALEATQLTGNISIASVKTNTDSLVAPAAGGYVRQDSTATIAKESGGNLATLVTNTANIATAANQVTGNASIATIAAAIKAEDTASTDGDSGIVSLSIREDVPTVSTSDNGDRAFIKSDVKGRVWVASDTLGPQLARIGDLLAQLLIEANVTNELLLQGLNVKGELSIYRNDSIFNNV